ncbi:hypothetical protein LOAG_02172 [Loa loa]|uniref:Uncharacterized protein n=1 Tax=Loa loa TaxID=7209 RepID=A0A1S0U798_LOALO|nr:hypothetical protein LOAG_02172 [Loa loa]EFO26317.1 hypothetical protein LOAG_02172 [Loa loa]
MNDDDDDDDGNDDDDDNNNNNNNNLQMFEERALLKDYMDKSLAIILISQIIVSVSDKVRRYAKTGIFYHTMGRRTKTKAAMHTMSAVGMFSTMVDQFSFVCIMTKCRDACTACEQCNYALDQLSKITSGIKTSNALVDI